MRRRERNAAGALLSVVLAGCNASVGPVVAYDFTRQKRVFGWEAGAGFGPERVNFGQSLGDKRVTYVVLEPWFYVGGTLGIGFHDGEASAVSGLWEALPLAMNYTDTCSTTPFVSLAAGYRYVGRSHQLYFAPKFGVMQCLHLRE